MKNNKQNESFIASYVKSLNGIQLLALRVTRPEFSAVVNRELARRNGNSKIALAVAA